MYGKTHRCKWDGEYAVTVTGFSYAIPQCDRGDCSWQDEERRRREVEDRLHNEEEALMLPVALLPETDIGSRRTRASQPSPLTRGMLAFASQVPRR